MDKELRKTYIVCAVFGSALLLFALFLESSVFRTVVGVLGAVVLGFPLYADLVLRDMTEEIKKGGADEK